MSSKLFVRNLSWSVTEDQLWQVFEGVGVVQSVTIPLRREDNKPRGFAFIEMGSSTEAQEAIRQCNGMLLDDRPIVVDYQSDDRGSGGGRSGGYGASSRGGGGSSPKTPSTKLFVRGLSATVNEGDLQDLFDQVGSVISVKIPTDRDTGMPKGFGFVEMSSIEEATAAIGSLNQQPLMGQALIIDYQDPNRSKPRTGGYGGSGGGGRSSYSGSGYGRSGSRW